MRYFVFLFLLCVVTSRFTVDCVLDSCSKSLAPAGIRPAGAGRHLCMRNGGDNMAKLTANRENRKAVKPAAHEGDTVGSDPAGRIWRPDGEPTNRCRAMGGSLSKGRPKG